MSCIHGPGFIITSFTDAEGEAVVNGKTVRWEFSDMFGPTFVNADGEPLKNQPGVRSAAWKAFERWHKELREEKALMSAAAFYESREKRS